MTALVGISCDGCQTTLTKTTIFQANIGEVREEGKARGWHKRRGVKTGNNGAHIGYTRDVCDECWAKGVR